MARFSLSSGLGSLGESDVSRLRAENNALQEELSQCQADKEFVWSLWKRLQVATPDLTQAIGLVMQREKEKAELKDRKILEILQMKDDKIDELQKSLSGNTKESTLFMSRNFEIEDENRKLKEENEDFRSKLTLLKNKCLDLESREHFVASRQIVSDLDKELLDAKQQLGKREEVAERLSRDKDDLTAIKNSHKERIENLEKDLKNVSASYEQLRSEHLDAKKLLKKYESELTGTKRDANSKHGEIESVRKELSELWETHNQTTEHCTQQTELIQQLRALQADTQKMMKNQEEAFCVEKASLQTMYQTLKASELELKRQVLSLKQQLSERQKKTIKYQDMSTDMDDELEDRLVALQTEVSSLRGRVGSKSRNGKLSMRDQASSPIRRDSPVRTRAMSRGRSPSVSKDRSLSPHRISDIKILQRKLANTERKLEDNMTLVSVKSKELTELRSAHNKRLERLKSLQANYRLVKKQLKVMEEELNGPKKKNKRLTRVPPKSLQKEDSDAVWNELAFFQHENKNLTVETMNLQEEVDGLRVKAAQDAASIHELKTCLEQEREELQFIVEQQEQERCSTPMSDSKDIQEAKDEVDRLKHKIKSLDIDLEQAELNKDKLSTLRQQWDEERRSLKGEVNSARHQESQQRIHIANLNKEMSRLQRELKKKKRDRKTPVAKRYQKILNRSIQQMSHVFDDFDKEGWEEIEESEDVTQTSTETTATTNSLGQYIVNIAKSSENVYEDEHPLTQVPEGGSAKKALPSHRQRESITEHVSRLSPKKPKNKKRFTSPDKRDAGTHATIYRDVALSPIHFMSSRPMTPHVVSNKASRHSQTGRQSVVALRQKISALNQQVSVMKSGRENSAKTIHDQRNLIEQLQSDLSSANHRLHGAKLTAQRLAAEVERFRAEKESLERQMADQSFSTNASARSDQEWNMLNSRLKNVTSEATRQLAAIRELKEENSIQQERIQSLQSRVNHLDRDVSQKRTLLEDMRSRLKLAQENAQADADIMLEVENKMKSLEETNGRYKTQIESLKQGIGAGNRGKLAQDEKVSKLLNEIDRKSKQVSELQKKNGHLMSSVSSVERSAQHQLHALANHSEVAIDTAQHRLENANKKIQEFNKLAKVLAHSILNSLQQARLLYRQQQQKKVSSKYLEYDPLVKKAQNWACQVMDISHSDLDELMSNAEEDKMSEASDASSQNKEIKKDKRWARKWERILQTEDFAVGITELFMEKVEERCQLALALQDA